MKILLDQKFSKEIKCIEIFEIYGDTEWLYEEVEWLYEEVGMCMRRWNDCMRRWNVYEEMEWLYEEVEWLWGGGNDDTPWVESTWLQIIFDF